MSEKTNPEATEPEETMKAEESVVEIDEEANGKVLETEALPPDQPTTGEGVTVEEEVATVEETAEEPVDQPAEESKTASPCACETAAAVSAVKKCPCDCKKGFLIAGMVVGAVAIIAGLCMLCMHTGVSATDLMGSKSSSYFELMSGTSSDEVMKVGFSLLLVFLGATDICAFGAVFAHGKKPQE